MERVSVVDPWATVLEAALAVALAAASAGPSVAEVDHSCEALLSCEVVLQFPAADHLRPVADLLLPGADRLLHEVAPRAEAVLQPEVVGREAFVEEPWEGALKQADLGRVEAGEHPDLAAAAAVAVDAV
jgi:hypothetical protein